MRTDHQARARRDLLVMAVLLAPALAAAQQGGPYDLSWSTLDAGGGTFSTAGVYLLGGSIGQPATNVLTGGAYSLSGGFWFGNPALLGVEDPTDPGSSDTSAPMAFRVYPSAPNPFGEATSIVFDLPEARSVTLEIYNAAGQLVRSILDVPLGAGRVAARWDGTDDAGRRVARGPYFARLRAGSESATLKLVLVR